MPKRIPHDEISHALNLLQNHGVLTQLPQKIQDAFASAHHRSMVNGFAEVSNEMAEICELATDIATSGDSRDVSKFLQLAQQKLVA